jgi:hypothetical protein
VPLLLEFVVFGLGPSLAHLDGAVVLVCRRFYRGLKRDEFILANQSTNDFDFYVCYNGEEYYDCTGKEYYDESLWHAPPGLTPVVVAMQTLEAMVDASGGEGSGRCMETPFSSAGTSITAHASRDLSSSNTPQFYAVFTP